MVVHPSDVSGLESTIATQFAELAPKPRTLGETGLDQRFVADLAAKHLFEAGALPLAKIAKRLALSGNIVESVLHFMRAEARIELTALQGGENAVHYRLTDRGRASATDALMRSGYVGPAPIPLQTYARIARAQTVHGRAVTRSAMHKAFADIVLKADLLDRLGPSLNSGRPIFVHGPAGTGKTFIAHKLKRLFHDRVLIPHAISIDEFVISVFDPIAHKLASARKAANGDNAASGQEAKNELRLDADHDPRFVVCERPVIVAGGELTADMLEVQFDAATREYRAPLQLKANNGMFVIDDMGRQKISPEAIFNRWIVPMEEKKDYLSLGSGRHFSVPFDVVLLFSTNLHPLELADEAFLRRIGYKIGFDYLTTDEYRTIWRNECTERGIVYEPESVEYVLTELHARHRVRLLPCHPRDLLSIAVDRVEYLGEPRRLTPEHLDWAWRNYFVSYEEAGAVAR
jgi:predicted ATPase with chaperone activity